jgi:hypothetical protein
MTDHTAVRRVCRYRALQKNEREIVRVDLQVPAWAMGDLKAIARVIRDRYASIERARREIDFVLGTINAPRSRHLDAKELVHCLTTPTPDHEWFPHMEALFDEVSVEAIHDLVLAGLVEFEDIYRSARTWRVVNGRNLPWIKEMATCWLRRLGCSTRYPWHLIGVLAVVRLWRSIMITVTVMVSLLLSAAGM